MNICNDQPFWIVLVGFWGASGRPLVLQTLEIAFVDLCMFPTLTSGCAVLHLGQGRAFLQQQCRIAHKIGCPNDLMMI
jgi:hypothetical protein